MKPTRGSIIENIRVNTLPNNALPITDLIADSFLLLILHRFHGCLLTLFDLHRLQQEWDAMHNHPCNLAFAMQTPMDELRADPFLASVGFTIIGDVEERLYHLLGAEIAKDKEQLIANGAMTKVETAKAQGLVHGTDTGQPLQLPAYFVLSPGPKLEFSHYCKHGGDMPGLSVLLAETGLKK